MIRRRIPDPDPWGNVDPPFRVPDVHVYSLRTSAALSENCVPNYVKPLDLISALDAAGVRSFLAGSHGMGGWRQKPRAAREVVLLVAARNHTKAVRTLLAAFPHLKAEEGDLVTTLRAPDPVGVVVEVLKPVQPLLKRALVKTHTVLVEGRTLRIPSLECALALLFERMIRLDWSKAEMHEHAGDFLRIVGVNPDIDLKELAALGELVNEGAGVEVVETVTRVRAGEKLNL